MISRRKHEAALAELADMNRRLTAKYADAAFARDLALKDNEHLSERLNAVAELLRSQPENATVVGINRVRTAMVGESARKFAERYVSESTS